MPQTIRYLFFGFAGLALFVGPACNTSPPSQTSCQQNTDCGIGSVCVQGFCQNQPSTQGKESGACYPNQTCDAGLVCQNNGICTKNNPSSIGEQGGPCYPNGTCNAALVCDGAKICKPHTPTQDPELDSSGAGAGSSVQEEVGAGGESCQKEAILQIPWLSQKLPSIANWNKNMCCGPATLAMGNAFLKNKTLTDDQMVSIIDWMDQNISSWSSTGYKCDAGGTDSDMMVKVAQGFLGLQAKVIRTDFCTLVSRYLNNQHAVIFLSGVQGSNNTTTFSSQGWHWVILSGISSDSAYIHDPGRGDASQGKGKKYTRESVQKVYDVKGKLAIILSLSQPQPQPTLPALLTPANNATLSQNASTTFSWNLGDPNKDHFFSVRNTDSQVLVIPPENIGKQTSVNKTFSISGNYRWSVYYENPACQDGKCAGVSHFAVQTSQSCTQTQCGNECVNTANNNQHCGQCNRSCSSNQTCQNGQCQSNQTCSQTQCGSECVNTSNNAQHCGQCNTPCPSPRSCQNGQCSCPTGQLYCNGSCVSTSSNQQHCGGCGISCTGNQTCQNGSCQSTCTQTQCGTECVNTSNNNQHCGQCYNSCGGSRTCQSGQCRCPSGQEYCNGSCVSTSDNNQHCGQCNRSCSSNQTCQNGSCQSTCTPNTSRICYNNAVYWQDNCGVRGTLIQSCSSSERCSNGQCVACPYRYTYTNACTNFTGGCASGNVRHSLKLCVSSVSGDNVTVHVRKCDNSAFATPATMTIRVGTYEPYGVVRATRSFSSGTSEVSVSFDLLAGSISNWPINTSKEFFATIDEGGQTAWRYSPQGVSVTRQCQ